MLLRYDPFRQLDRVANEVFGTDGRSPWTAMDAVRRGDHVEIFLDLPGVERDSIDLTVERNVLTVKAERSWTPAEGDEVLVRERTQGAFSRQVLLGDALDGDRVEARYHDGVLHVTVPVAEQAKPRKVEIHTEEPLAVEATAN